MPAAKRCTLQNIRRYICRVMAVTAMLAFLGMLTGCRPYLKGPMGSESRPLLLRLKKMYLAPSAPPLQAAAAAWALRQDHLPSSFWAEVADTEPRGTVRFRVAVLVLFTDYLHRNMTLGQLSVVLRGAKWLLPSDLSRKKYFTNLFIAGIDGSQPTYQITVGREYAPKLVTAPGGRLFAMPGATVGPSKVLYNAGWRRRDVVMFTLSRNLRCYQVYDALRGLRSRASDVRVQRLGIWIINTVDRPAILNTAGRKLVVNGSSVGSGGRAGADEVPTGGPGGEHSK